MKELSPWGGERERRMTKFVSKMESSSSDAIGKEERKKGGDLTPIPLMRTADLMKII
jgi:hypothetical protein